MTRTGGAEAATEASRLEAVQPRKLDAGRYFALVDALYAFQVRSVQRLRCTARPTT